MPYFRLLLILIGVCLSFDASALRQFPPATIYGSIEKINYPQITIQEIPSNLLSSMLGMIFLQSRVYVMSPASVIRDPYNNTHVQNYLYNLQNGIVAIQLDYQGRIWTIWVLTQDEVNWVIKNNLNNW